nr:TRAP transporter small permease subunit [Halomonas sp.]
MTTAPLAPWRERGAAVSSALSRPLVGLGLLVGRFTSWLVLLVMAAVLLTVLLNATGINEIARWNDKVLLFGNALTINSITELQWHLFGVLTLFGGTYALHHDTHVRVDLIYHRLSPSHRAMVDVIGHLVLLIPFCLLVAWLSKHFVTMSFLTGEKSNYGGLTDRYLIKAILPISLVFLALGALGQVFEKLTIILDPRKAETDHEVNNG